MPFKSKAQWHKFFAMAAKGEIPESTAKEWAHATTKAYKTLPNKKASIADAYATGYTQALTQSGIVSEKQASVIPGLAAHYLLPSALGAFVAGPDNRAVGAAAGLGAATVGKLLARRWLSSAAGATPEMAKLLRGSSKKELQAMASNPNTSEELSRGVKSYLSDASPVQAIFGAGAGAGAGYGVNRLMNNGNAYDQVLNVQPTTTYLW